MFRGEFALHSQRRPNARWRPSRGRPGSASVPPAGARTGGWLSPARSCTVAPATAITGRRCKDRTAARAAPR